MLNADLPQLLCSSVVRKLKTDSTFKLLILEGGEERETERNVKKGAVGTAPGVFC